MKRAALIIPTLVGLAGLLVTLRVPLASGFDRIHADEGDARHQNYVLEHAHRALIGDRAHADIWSPPVFFPARDTGPYSEMLLGAVPIYTPLRLIGLEADSALQVFTALVLGLNFAAAYLLFSAGYGFGVAGSSAGAYLFAFSAYRAVHIGHHLLLAQFYGAIALLALARGLRAHSEGRETAVTGWVALFSVAVVGQVYAGIHLGWFLLLCLGIALPVALVLPASRPLVGSFLKTRWRVLSICAFVSAIAVAPLIAHHMLAMRETGGRSYALVADFLPPLKAWVNPGAFSWVYSSWLGRWDVVRGLPYFWEKALFPGVVTGVLVAWGISRTWSRPAVRIGALTGVVLVLLATSWPGGHSLWRLVYDFVPGAKGMRAVGRLSLLLLVPMSAAIAAAVDELLSRRRAYPAIACLLLFAGLEQVQVLPSYDRRPVRDRVAAVKAAIPTSCKAFFYAPIQSRTAHWVTQLDGMWASLEAGIPTANGYSSNLPPGWDPLMAHELAEPGETRVRRNVADWERRNGLPPGTICVFSVPANAYRK